MAELPQRLQRFIRDCVPTYEAAEVLLFFARHEQRWFTPDEVVAGLRPTVVRLPALKESLGAFGSAGIIAERDGRFAYRPETREIVEAIDELTRAYNERPVTLIKTIYRIADSRIQSFSDSFRLRKD